MTSDGEPGAGSAVHAARRWAYRRYRRAKTWMVTRRPPVLTWAFFTTLAVAERLLSARRLTAAQARANRAWVRAYRHAGRAHPGGRPRLRTAHALAADSDDHRHPLGSIRDNSSNPRFNRAVYAWLGHPANFSLLDLGCAGGGLVRSVLADGYLAVGLEGSDVSRRQRSGEWATIPHHLFTCDIVKPFRVLRGDGRPARFHVVTMWEVLEHIAEADLPALFRNIRAHLKPGGVFIASVNTLPDANPLKGAVYHRTLRPRAWWERRLRREGFAAVRAHPFAAADMVRGNGLTLNEWDPADRGGFHLVMRRDPLPRVPRGR